ncbi:hypothetical protein [Haladaptatus cibarius]|uniref:hypothetical protein n=1 Tax=Haladaptatus cibarius TaxID=453847 RepID=UPI0006787BC2|nr:hypothetical protein [Haladaptatus cibarius]
MSGTTPFENDGDDISRTAVGREKLTALHAKYREHALTTPLQFVSFWSAVVLPFLYVPLLMDGLAGAEITVFLSLLACHVVALFAGHSYGQE